MTYLTLPTAMILPYSIYYSAYEDGLTYHFLFPGKRKIYSIIVRECTGKQIMYDWYLIPSDFPVLNPAFYKWHHKIGKNKGVITGWETDMLNGSRMSIAFSMSSQLWIDVLITEEMKKFIVGYCRINCERKYNYIQLYDNDRDSTSLGTNLSLINLT